MPQRRLLVTGIALILSILTYLSTMALVQPSVASAHAYVIGSDPVDGSTVATTPKEVHIYFNAPVSPLSSAHVYSIQGGNLIDVGAAPSQVAPSNEQELVIPIKTPSAQPKGGYEVIWSAVANNDGHTTEGIIGFNVGFSSLAGFTGTPILGPSTSNDLEDIHTLDLTALLAIVWEWIGFMALTAWIGIVVMEQFVLDRGRGLELLAQVRKQTYSLQRLCLATLLFGEGIALFLRVVHLMQIQHSNISPVNLTLMMIVQTSYGHIWLLRIILIALIMGLLYRTHQPRKNRPPSESIQSTTHSKPELSQSAEEVQVVETNQTDDAEKLKESAGRLPALSLLNHRVVWLILIGLLTLLFVFASPAAQVLEPHFSAMLFDWLSKLTLGIWFGSVAYVSYALLPLLRAKNRDCHAETLAKLLRRLTPILLISISIQLLSLFFLSETSIHDPQQLWHDPYGLALTAQVTLIAISVLLSAYILFVLRPRVNHQTVLQGKGTDVDLKHHLKLATGIFSVLGIGSLLCSALMSFFAPPIVFPDVTYTNQLESPTNAVNTQTKQIGPLSVTLELLPGHIDQFNTVIILIKDKHGKPVTDAQVQLSTNMQIMDMGTQHAQITGGHPVYATTFDPHHAFTMAGPWIITVEIQLPNQPSVQDTFEVMLS